MDNEFRWFIHRASARKQQDGVNQVAFFQAKAWQEGYGIGRDPGL